VEFHLFLPQMRMSIDRLVGAARDAERAGFRGIAGMDHLAPPLGADQPMYEAIVTNTWLAARTDRLTVSSLVMCDAFRHPAVLSRQAVTLDHASGGRFELGIGWGSWSEDFSVFGVTPSEPRARVQRLRETLEVIKALWAGESVDYDGEYYRLHGARQAPLPLKRIPIVIGGSGPKTLALVREHADWWNADVRYRDRFERGKFEELRGQAGGARVSVQQRVAYVPRGADRAAIAQLAERRFASSDAVVGSGAELVEHFGKFRELGIERVYAWFCDFAQPDTLAGFGDEVIGKLPAIR
jgi:alkanesulfonate monooxygenase SsuD/methylene tetrahydromethanopterin reductase-like flavin-dependent oxidoreductase (luciferase family)